MNLRNIIAVITVLSLLSGVALVIQTEMIADKSNTKIELLKDPVAGETNTLQASSNETDLKRDEVYVNGEEYGTLNDAGIAKFKVPNTEEIKIEINGHAKTFLVEKNDSPVYEEGINLENRPVQGEINRVILIKNGDRLPNETVSVNNNEIGRTGQSGAVKFTVPKTTQIELKTSAENIQSRTVQVEDQE